jgi:exopolysaccharide biosynthesis WecB/TagA/CpsF family protein
MALVCVVDDYDVDGFVRVAKAFGQDRYGYAVTPNVDHLIRYHDDAEFRAASADATFVLVDSRVLSYLLRFMRGIRTKVCTGSDLTQRLFHEVIAPDDRIVLIGGTHGQANALAKQFGLTALSHHNPAMGFIRDPQAIEACLSFVEENSPFRFCFLAVGAPQQEHLATCLKKRGKARGLALCIGASINFMTGVERRAPRWMQRFGLEWLFRLSRDPRRLTSRYLIRGPRVFRLLERTHVALREPTVPP